jgi:hypothetical protein
MLEPQVSPRVDHGILSDMRLLQDGELKKRTGRYLGVRVGLEPLDMEILHSNLPGICLYRLPNPVVIQACLFQTLPHTGNTYLHYTVLPHSFPGRAALQHTLTSHRTV